MPIATSMVAVLLTTKSRKLLNPKNEGATTATTTSKTANDAAAEISRLYFSMLSIL
jgi:hypothetical protein